MSARQTIGVVHHNLMLHRGGGDLVCAWALDALHRHYDVTLLTWGPPIDWKDLNTYFGTTIDPQRLRTHYVRSLTRLRLDQRPFRLILALFERDIKRIKDQFDILLSTYNEFDFGKPGVQYVHGPSRSASAAKLYLLAYKENGFRRLYHRVCDWYSGYAPKHVLANTTLVNSDWSRTIYQTAYPGAQAFVLYPPIILVPGVDHPWSQRPLAEFVCLGDLLAEKKVLEAIDLVEELSRRRWPVHLHIVGDGNSPYAVAVKARVRSSNVVTLHGRLNRPQVSTLLRRYRYGLHMRDFEGFGIAVAEMATAGMIVFAHEGGGQAEVLDHEARVLFKDNLDALSKIETVLRQESLQHELRDRLQTRAKHFSVERFSQELRRFIEDFLIAHDAD